MLFDPRVQVKAVECDSHLAHANDDQPWANVAVEDSPPNTAVGRGIAIADHARLYYDRHGASTVISKINSRQRCS
jgi:hypothetical protein